jgi:hypothetical protein
MLQVFDESLVLGPGMGRWREHAAILRSCEGTGSGRPPPERAAPEGRLEGTAKTSFGIRPGENVGLAP